MRPPAGPTAFFRHALLVALSIGTWGAASAQGTARVCVASTVERKPYEEPLSAPGMSTGPHVFVQVNGLPRQRVAPDRAARFDSLDATGPHVVKIYDARGRQLLLSFPFRFEDHGSTALCLRQNTLYRTWMLARACASCACTAELGGGSGSLSSPATARRK